MDDQHDPLAPTLFELTEAPNGRSVDVPAAPPRMQRADRAQVRLRPVDLDGLLPADHRARLVWDFVGTLDLSAFHARIRAVEGHPGRPPIDPAILVSLWLYATLEGVGSARALDRLCEEHDAYRWLCGGVGVNHHTLADFRVAGADLLDGLLAQSVAALMAGGAVTLARVAHDGIRVRASAGAASYRSRGGLERALADATARVDALRRELDADPGATSRRVAAARERAVREREARVRDALAALDALERGRRSRAKRRSEPRASTTDPGARIMKMADGGFRPAWNAQLTGDVGSGCVVGVAVHDGIDLGRLGPAVESLVARHGRRPAEVLADGGFAAIADLEALTVRGTIPYVPLSRRAPMLERRGRRGDTPAITAWRVRMQTDEAQAIYRGRAATIEWINALARNRGLQQCRVRGRDKVRSMLLWFGLAHNLARGLALRQPAVA
jgi:transposase